MTECRLCEEVKTTTPIYEDELWHLIPFREVPGFLVLMTKRHTGDIQTFSAAELASFGPTLARITAALQEAASAERVYFASFGENNQHFHTALCARVADIPAEHRGPRYLVNFGTYDGQPAEAARVADSLRAALVVPAG